MTIDLEKLERIDLKPGEVLAITLAASENFGGSYTQAQLEAIKVAWSKKFPDIPVVIFTPGTELKAINPNV